MDAKYWHVINLLVITYKLIRITVTERVELIIIFLSVLFSSQYFAFFGGYVPEYDLQIFFLFFCTSVKLMKWFVVINYAYALLLVALEPCSLY